MINNSETTIISDINDLNKIFGHDITRKGIKPKFIMPKIGGKPKTIRILHSKDASGNLGVIYTVKNEKMNTGTAIFMTVEDYENPGTEFIMGVGKSLFNNFDALCNENKITLADLPGKIVQISASPYKEYVCKSCNGAKGGCQDCGFTGHSTVFNLTMRNDLMSTTKNVKKITNDEF